MTATPRLDAILRWRNGDDTAFPPDDFDPVAGMSDDEIVAYCISHAASGAPAILPPKYVTVRGHKIPAPPGGPKPFKHGRRGKPPKSRKRQKNAREP